MSLFIISPNISHITPNSLQRAVAVASLVLRSDAYQDILVNIHSRRETPHIDAEELRLLLLRDNLFTIDRIRIGPQMDARALTYRRYDPWAIYLNSLLLLELSDCKRELADALAAYQDFTATTVIENCNPLN